MAMERLAVMSSHGASATAICSRANEPRSAGDCKTHCTPKHSISTCKRALFFSLMYSLRRRHHYDPLTWDGCKDLTRAPGYLQGHSMKTEGRNNQKSIFTWELDCKGREELGRSHSEWPGRQQMLCFTSLASFTFELQRYPQCSYKQQSCLAYNRNFPSFVSVNVHIGVARRQMSRSEEDCREHTIPVGLKRGPEVCLSNLPTGTSSSSPVTPVPAQPKLHGVATYGLDRRQLSGLEPLAV